MTVKSKLLELLELHKGETLSGEKLAGKLSCTRAAVWKAVKSLREEGYQIEAGPNRGYRLSWEASPLSAEGVRLSLNHAEAEVRLFPTVTSTNHVARLTAFGGGFPHGSVVLALEQTEGRGRRGRSFYSPKDGGLYFSVVLRPQNATLQENLLITTAAAAAVYQAVWKICGISLDIKWVNDLYRDGRKVCGILTEAVTDFESGNIEFAVVGIGLNLYPPPEGYPPELADIVGTLYPSRQEAASLDVNRLAAEIVNELLCQCESRRLSEIYVEHNLIPGREIRITGNGSDRLAKALEICPDGRLLVEEQDGTRSVLSYGEVSVCMEDISGSSNGG